MAAALATTAAPLSAAGQCPLKGPNLLVDADFAMEAENPSSPHWTRARHAGANGYQVTIDKGELTISKVAPQDWFSYSQTVPVAKLRRAKMAFTAELKLDLMPVANSFSTAPGGGLDIAARSRSGDVIWSSWRNHEPRTGKTDWVTVQVVFKVPARADRVALRFMHDSADGTLQVRNPSFRQVDETRAPCPVTPDRSSSADAAAETPLR